MKKVMEDMKKVMEECWNKHRDQIVKSRRQYRQQMCLASPEEKERLRRERQHYVARTWYQVNREGEARKRKERRQRTCCPSKKLGREVAPQDGFVTLWITKCKECGRQTQGKFGANKQGRVAVFFRGRWFKEIDPNRGTAKTFQGQDISLTDA